mgnify:CR=1 FL=1
MKQKKCFMAVAASMLVTAASFTSCSNQDNLVYDPSSQPVVPGCGGSSRSTGLI